MENRIVAVVMAAGDDDRMKSSLPKVMHKICGHPMIEYVVDAVLGVDNCEPIVVLGEGGEE